MSILEEKNQAKGKREKKIKQWPKERNQRQQGHHPTACSKKKKLNYNGRKHLRCFSPDCLPRLLQLAQPPPESEVREEACNNKHQWLGGWFNVRFGQPWGKCSSQKAQANCALHSSCRWWNSPCSLHTCICVNVSDREVCVHTGSDTQMSYKTQGIPYERISEGNRHLTWSWKHQEIHGKRQIKERD